ncbi:MAG TPA: hypothetical protein VGJ05_21620 [Fimbriiglobus sp.]
MRRIAVLAAFALTMVVGLGCKHIAGKCDCTAHPDDAAIYTPGNPYPVVTPPAPGK